MNRRASFRRLLLRTVPLSLGLPALVLLGLSGCGSTQVRSQAADEERERYEVKTVGEVSTVGSAEPIAVGGVGLVVDLEGTGGEPANDGNRQMLEDYLKKKQVPKIKELLQSPNVALVLVSARIAPGTGKHETFDVEVTIAPRSKATSLRGGYLKECVLYNYETTKNLSPNYAGPNAPLKGHAIAKAEGPIMVGLSEDQAGGRVKQGRIWGGGWTTADMPPLTLLLNSDNQYARVASQVADRINETFCASARGVPGSEVAIARNHLSIALRVPAQYRLNLPHFLRVVRLVPRFATPTASPDGTERPYPQRLAVDLLDPAHTVTAAMRLEALGASSIPLLKKGLESKEWLVRFCSAESLAYLGSPSACEELARMVEQQPLARSFALTALASLDEGASQVQLQQLMMNSADDEVRYGAFRALRTLDARNPLVQGERLNQSFTLNRVAPDRPGLVHFSTQRRAEIVIFGPEPLLMPPFSFLAGDFTLTATEEGDCCTISHIPPRGGEPIRKQCSLKLCDILRTMANLGGTYPEALEVLRQSHNCQCVTSRVRCDALPQATTAFDLVKAGRGETVPSREGKSSLDLSLPTAPADMVQGQHLSEPDANSLLRPRQPGGDNKSALRRPAIDE